MAKGVPPKKPVVQQQPKVVPPKQQKAAPAKPPKPPKAAPREKQTMVWETDNDIDFEDLTFVIPIIIASILLFVFFLRMYIRWTVQCPSRNRLEGKTVIVTGANTGIGKATAMELSRRGAKVILGCRDQAKGEAVSRLIKTKTKHSDVYAYKLDLASQASIKAFVDDFNSREPALHILINNAAYQGPRAATEEGYERNFGVNYLGHFYLTYLLKDKLKRGAPSRIINLVSDSYSKAKLDFEDLALTKYDIHKAYARSKLALMMFNVELHRRWSSDIVMSYGAFPGWVCTDLMRNWPGATGNILRTMSRILFKSPDDGCQTAVFCAVADKLRDHSGKVFENCSLMKVKDYVRDRERGKKLWNISLGLCHLEHERDEDFGPAQPAGNQPEVQDVGHSEDKKEK